MKTLPVFKTVLNFDMLMFSISDCQMTLSFLVLIAEYIAPTTDHYHTTTVLEKYRKMDQVQSAPNAKSTPRNATWHIAGCAIEVAVLKQVEALSSWPVP